MPGRSKADGGPGCWGQSAGGYGDGVASGEGGGHWLIEDSVIAHNTSDGLDLLYLQPGSSVEIRRTLVEGNAGNQIKVTGPLILENSILVGDCGFFKGKPFTHHVDNCRAAGNALAVYLYGGDQVSVVNNTLLSAGDCLVYAELEEAGDGSETVYLRNNIFLGWPDFESPSEQSCLVYEESFPTNPFDIDYSLIAGVKDGACPGPHDLCPADLGLTNASQEGYDAHLLPGSPAVDAGLPDAAPADDFAGHARDEAPDIGALELQDGR